MVSPRETRLYIIAFLFVLFGALGLISYIEGGDHVLAEQEALQDKLIQRHIKELHDRQEDRWHHRYSVLADSAGAVANLEPTARGQEGTR
jgi:hypothetical protein